MKDEESRKYTYELFKLTSKLNLDDANGWYLRNLRETLDHIYVPLTENNKINFIKFNSKYKFSPKAYRYIINCLKNSHKIETKKLVLEHVLPHKILITEIINKFKNDKYFDYNKFINYLEKEFTDDRKVIITKDEDLILNSSDKDTVPDRDNPFSRYQVINLKQEDFKSVDTLLFLYYKYAQSESFSICNNNYINENIIKVIKNRKIKDINNIMVKLNFIKLDNQDFQSKENKTKYVLLELVDKKNKGKEPNNQIYINLNNLLTESLDNNSNILTKNFKKNLDKMMYMKLTNHFSKK